MKALAARGQIAPDLEERMAKYSEDRHTLIHRWMREKGWPAEDDVAGFRPIIELARQIEAEADFLARSLASYMVRLSDPAWEGPSQAEYKERVARLFHDAHMSID